MYISSVIFYFLQQQNNNVMELFGTAFRLACWMSWWNGVPVHQEVPEQRSGWI